MDFAPGERERERDRDLAERTEKAPLRRLSLEEEEEWWWWLREWECERWPVDLWETAEAASSKRPMLRSALGGGGVYYVSVMRSSFIREQPMLSLEADVWKCSASS